MQSKTLRIILIVILGLMLVCGSFAGGIAVGYFTPRVITGSEQSELTTGPTVCTIEGTECPACLECPTCTETSCPTCTCPVEGSTPKDLEALFKPFWQTWNLVLQNYVDQPVDQSKMMQGAISGMLAALGDKHTSYMDPKEFEQANTSLEGEYTGIGAWIDITGEYVEIISPMKGMPAEAAGLKAGDLILKINGEDMTDIDGALVQQRILGPAGEDVTLTILRGEETLDVTITRAKIVVPVVDYEMLEGNIAYVALYNFNDFSTPKLREALEDLMDQNPKGLIFDLRDNGGGYLTTAIEVASEFIGNGVIMYEEYGDGTRDTYTAQRGGLATDIPLVVLVNEGTASASEIVAGAIQDRGRGELVGVVTYGKGTVQTWIGLDDNSGGVRITIARWLTPNEKQISDVGLTPDYIVEYTEEDFNAGIDPQLDKAIEVLNGGN